MMFKNCLYFAAFFVSLSAFSKEVKYDREKCDKLIGVEKYIVAGSMDNTTPGGTTYNFNKIVNSLTTELLNGKEPPRLTCRCRGRRIEEY